MKCFPSSQTCCSYSNVCSSNDLANIGLLDGVIAIGTESFHWTSPNWISIGFVENRTVGCMETGFWGIKEDGVDFFWPWSNVNDCDEWPMNWYPSTADEMVGVVSSSTFEDGVTSVDLIFSIRSRISIGLCWASFPERENVGEKKKLKIVPRRWTFERDDDDCRLLPPRSDGVGDVCCESERSLSLCIPLFDNWSLVLVLWFFFLWFDLAFCQPPS